MSLKDAGAVIRAADHSPTNSELKTLTDTRPTITYYDELYDLKTIQEFCSGLKKVRQKIFTTVYVVLIMNTISRRI